MPQVNSFPRRALGALRPERAEERCWLSLAPVPRGLRFSKYSVSNFFLCGFDLGLANMIKREVVILALEDIRVCCINFILILGGNLLKVPCRKVEIWEQQKLWWAEQWRSQRRRMNDNTESTTFCGMIWTLSAQSTLSKAVDLRHILLHSLYYKLHTKF